MKLPTPKTLGAGSGGALAFGVLFGWIAFPKILKSQITKQMTLAKGTDIREMWTTVPFALDFKIYVFNCTNPFEVMKGSKPEIKEIGPFYYEEWKEKVNMVDIEEEDAISYNRRDTFLFKKEKSGPGLTGDEIIVSPHIFMVSAAIAVARDKPAMLSLVGKAINGIFDNPETVFLTTKVRDILFDGIVINCDRTDFAPKAVCTAIKKEARDIEIFGKNQIRFSLFGRKNGTIEEPKFKVLRGIKNIRDVGKVLEFNGETSQSVWTAPGCNEFGGTDATVFAPFLTEKDELLSFTPDICRSLGAWYDSKSVYAGIPTNRYIANLGDLANEPQNQCFCDTPTTCPPKGLMDLTKCLNAPLVVSMPHFFETDPKILDGVKGLRPNKEDHGIVIDFEPITGTPMMAKKRLQFNIMLPKIEKLELFKNLPNTLFPLFWVEEGLALNKTFVSMLNNQLFIPMRVVGVIKWLSVCLGCLGLVISGLLHQKQRIIRFAVVPANTVESISTVSKPAIPRAELRTNGHSLNGIAPLPPINKDVMDNQIIGGVDRF